MYASVRITSVCKTRWSLFESIALGSPKSVRLTAVRRLMEERKHELFVMTKETICIKRVSVERRPFIESGIL